MTTSRSPLAPHVQAFFTDHLSRHKRASPQTIASCRDAFRLLLPFVKETTGIEPSALCVADLDAPIILAFLDHLERERGNQVRSRNIRLSALRTFFRFVALRDPESIQVATRVMAIPIKREDKKLVGSLTRAEIEALIAAPDRSQWIGRRDHALLLTLYNSGARVSEITTLKRGQVSFGATTFLELHGKGRKERTIPLWPQTRDVLQRWFRELGEETTQRAFPNARGRPLARHSVNYLIHKAVQSAAASCPSLLTRPITPHLVRHYLPFLTISGNVGKHRYQRGSGTGFTRDNLGVLRKTKNRHRIDVTRSAGPEPRESRVHLLSLLAGRRADAE